MLQDRAAVIIPNTVLPRPEDHEIDTARTLAAYFNAAVEFIPARKGYKMRSPDVMIGNATWEIKSPVGSSNRSTIQKQFKGLKQSRNLVIDGRRSGLNDKEILASITVELNKRHRVQRLLYITKSGVVLAIQ